jgi:hypothetical protein
MKFIGNFDAKKLDTDINIYKIINVKGIFVKNLKLLVKV